MEEVKYKVAVHKAALSLFTNESVGNFTKALTDAGRKSLKTKLALSDKVEVYAVEIFATAVILEAYDYEQKDASKRMQYYAVPYTRDAKTGSFTFDQPVQVVRRTIFEKAPTGVSISKAMWSTAEINNLPDAAFALILPGGKKDKDGKTVPRSLRYLPHHNGSVKSPTEDTSIDKPHLENALAQLPKSNLSPEQQAKAKAHLVAHAKKVLASYQKTKKGMPEFIEGWEYTEKSLWKGVI